ncbi:MAG: GGDEF domain-containing protein [Eubacterium sp.]|nr:GGDEF domain-containing protein [Eubacterium sp.]
MAKKKKKTDNGVSLRTLHILLVIGAFLLSALMLYSTFYLSSSFRNLTAVSEQNTELQKASIELMYASNYMTERVQRFTNTGNKQLLQEYFNEAFSAKHREEAIEKMSRGSKSDAALKELKAALESSRNLMDREYYAFRLVIEAKGYTDYPEQLEGVVLSERDKALTAEKKMYRAADIVTDNEYYVQKHMIRENMQGSLNELEKAANEEYESALKDMRIRMSIVRVMIVLETLAVFFLVWLASYLGINPIVRAVEKIKNNSKIPESGTTEFRYLVRAYNQMYEMYRSSLERLDFKASHDELTGVYNRTGYQSLLDSIDIKSTYMLLFDIDNFKSINDTYGHETGDKVLKKLVWAMRKNFRPDDFICRIGGDEFIVLMMHTPDKQQELIASKIDIINKTLEDCTDGLPRASISVGIVHGSEADKMEELMEKTDVAMYESKKKGKKTYTFYSPVKSDDDQNSTDN